MAKVITFFNNKGGVGKTTSSVLLADYFEKKNKKVLLIDLDPQGNLSKTFFDYEDLFNTKSFYDFSEYNTEFSDIILKYSDNISLIPSDIKMHKIANHDTMHWKEKKHLLKNLSKKYDLIILDSPPAINTFSWLALLVCNYAFIPLMSDAFSRDGLQIVLESFAGLKDLNPDYEGYRAFISAHKNQRIIFKDEIQQYFQEELGETLLKNKIPDFIGLQERQVMRENIFSTKNSTNKNQINRLELFCKELEGHING